MARRGLGERRERAARGRGVGGPAVEVAGAHREAAEGHLREPDAHRVADGVRRRARGDQAPPRLVELAQLGPARAELVEQLADDPGDRGHRRLDHGEVVGQVAGGGPEVAERHAQPPEVAEREGAPGDVAPRLLGEERPLVGLAGVHEQPLVVEELAERVVDPARIGKRPGSTEGFERLEAAVQLVDRDRHVAVQAPRDDAPQVRRDGAGERGERVPTGREEGQQGTQGPGHEPGVARDDDARAHATPASPGPTSTASRASAARRTSAASAGERPAAGRVAATSRGIGEAYPRSRRPRAVPRHPRSGEGRRAVRYEARDPGGGFRARPPRTSVVLTGGASPHAVPGGRRSPCADGTRRGSGSGSRPRAGSSQ